jgi:hypothetical protein
VLVLAPKLRTRRYQRHTFRWGQTSSTRPRLHHRQRHLPAPPSSESTCYVRPRVAPPRRCCRTGTADRARRRDPRPLPEPADPGRTAALACDPARATSGSPGAWRGRRRRWRRTSHRVAGRPGPRPTPPVSRPGPRRAAIPGVDESAPGSARGGRAGPERPHRPVDNAARVVRGAWDFGHRVARRPKTTARIAIVTWLPAAGSMTQCSARSVPRPSRRFHSWAPASRPTRGPNASIVAFHSFGQARRGSTVNASCRATLFYRYPRAA